jgi:hypothetical protein
MFKSIPKSNISKRSFKVYKLWSDETQASAPIIKVYNTSGSYFDENSPTSQGYVINSLYNSIKSKYYSSEGNAFTTFGSVENLAEYKTERLYPTDSNIYVFSIKRSKFGEQIKPNSVELTVGGLLYIDDGYGQLKTPDQIFELISLDLDNNGIGLLTIGNGIDIFEIELKDSTMLPTSIVDGNVVTTGSIDLNNGICYLIYQSAEDTITLVSIDFENGTIEFLEQFNFEGTELATQIHGNVFYDEGLVVLTTQDIEPTGYSINFRSTQTIYETEILVSADTGEFNYSQNPSAVDVTLSGSYDFETTAIPNVSSAKTVKIKEVLDIKRKETFGGSMGSIQGSWNDYYNYGLSDPTGSYLTPYITTIGLYDDDDNLLVVAKLPKPIKNLPDYNVNFLVRFDT